MIREYTNNYNNVFAKNSEKRASRVKKIAKALRCYEIPAWTEKVQKNYALNYQAELVSLWDKKLENKPLAEVLMK